MDNYSTHVHGHALHVTPLKGRHLHLRGTQNGSRTADNCPVTRLLPHIEGPQEARGEGRGTHGVAYDR